MRSLKSCVLLGGLLVGLGGSVEAQVSVTFGNPYANQGMSYPAPGYGYASGYSNVGGYGTGSGYSNNYQSYSSTGYLAGPGVIGGQYGYSSGYSGIVGGNPTGYRNRPYYGAYGYGNYSNGSIDGYAPFRPANRFRRTR